MYKRGLDMPAAERIISGIKTIGERFSTLYADARTFHADTINRGTVSGIMRAQSKRQNYLEREFSIYSSIFQTAIKPIERDLKNVKNMPKDVSAAWKSGTNIKTKTGKAYRNGVKPHLPGILAYIGTVVPVPLAQPFGYVLGQVLKYLT